MRTQNVDRVAGKLYPACSACPAPPPFFYFTSLLAKRLLNWYLDDSTRQPQKYSFASKCDIVHQYLKVAAHLSLNVSLVPDSNSRSHLSYHLMSTSDFRGQVPAISILSNSWIPKLAVIDQSEASKDDRHACCCSLQRALWAAVQKTRSNTI